MFITKVKTRTSKSGTDYYTYKLLTSARLGVLGSPKVKTVLNLGAGFSFPSELWKELAGRVDQILCGETSLFPCRPEVEKEAVSLVSAIKANSSSTGTESNRYIPLDGYYLHDMGSKHHRTVGVESIGLHAANQLRQHGNCSGKRVERGLFRAGNGRLINADVNGALNIMMAGLI
ncbi:MAG: hypothetical protein LBK52_02265, partial [Deltaproteobacteria bacterium]|nr:hypothetical protein [Deltaproteobacteria bacterium]